jgi:hypothetical protein
LSLARYPASLHVAVDRAAHGRRRVAAALAEMTEVRRGQSAGGVNLGCPAALRAERCPLTVGDHSIGVAQRHQLAVAAVSPADPAGGQARLTPRNLYPVIREVQLTPVAEPTGQ